jgi:tRNA dimethylallyltransferase
MLATIDPDYAAELDARNYRYVMRGLEVFRATGKSKKTDNRLGEGQYDTFFLTPYDGKREALYEKINQRVLEMFEQGLLEEVESLLRQYVFGTFDSKSTQNC